eukprot:247005_1
MFDCKNVLMEGLVYITWDNIYFKTARISKINQKMNMYIGGKYFMNAMDTLIYYNQFKSKRLLSCLFLFGVKSLDGSLNQLKQRFLFLI